MKIENREKLAAALLIAAGLALCGFLAGFGIKESRAPVRTVTVKGLSERDVKADLALWSVNFVRAGNDLTKTRAEIMKDDAVVTVFLEKQGIAGDVISRKMNVIDKNAQQYGDGNEAQIRFIITRSVMLRSNDIKKIEEAYKQTAQLINEGVVLSSEGMENNSPVYIFNGLTKLKPSMIAEANKNARETAEQFAKDSQSSLGKILVADQGIFQILPRDNAPMLQESQQTDKTVRVVVTIKYQLKN
ncbi:MAG: SIMPL domain-containing protein [Synergistaceae bacterium]|nr:SIMPL domain-containing protein [Synergistaceae bacterium]